MGASLPPLQIAKGVGGFEGPIVIIPPPLESQFLHMLCLYNFLCACVPSVMAPSLVLFFCPVLPLSGHSHAAGRRGGPSTLFLNLDGPPY